MSRSKYRVSQVIHALRENHGLLSLTAEALGVTRQTVYTYVDKYPEVADVLAEQREKLVDLAERSLYQHVENGAPWAISLVLKTLGRSRGFVESVTREPASEPLENAIVLKAIGNGHAEL